jgi:hypothetical protein
LSYDDTKADVRRLELEVLRASDVIGQLQQCDIEAILI